MDADELKKILDERDVGLDRRFAQFEERADERATKFEQRMDERMVKFEERMEKQITALSDGLLKLYQHVDERFEALEVKIDRKADGERVYTMLDGLAKCLDDDEAERAALGHQLHRHEGWIGQLAEKTGTPLRPPLAEQ